MKDNRALYWGLVIAGLLTMVLGSGSRAFADPKIYIDRNAGNDANDGKTPGTAVQNWPRVLELYNPSDPAGCDTDVKWVGESDTPPIEIAEMILRVKKDKAEKHETAEVVPFDPETGRPGHGQLPSLDESNSPGCGWGHRRTWVWLTYTNMNGLQEYCSEVRDEVFAD